MANTWTRRHFIRDTSLLGLATQLPALGWAKTESLGVSMPNSNEKLMRIGLGTYKTFDVGSDPVKREELKKVLAAFIKLGGRMIDSSPMYGTSEQVIGELSTELKLNEKLFMATKVWTSGQTEGQQQVQESFDLLKRKKVELFQIHNLVDWKTQLKTLRKLKDEGKINYIGITHFTPSAFTELESVIKAEPIEFLQIPYSIIETRADKSLIPLASSKGIKVIANEPFAHGDLFRLVKGKDLPAFAKDLGIQSWAQFFLKFIIGNPDVHFAIPGTGKLKHLEDNLGAATGQLPNPDQRQKMIATLK